MILVIVLGSIFYLILGLGAKKSTTNHLLSQEQVIVRAESANISSFFQTYGNAVAILAQDENLQTPNGKTQAVMDTFIDQWRSSGVVAGVVFTDKKGIAKFDSNISKKPDLGKSLSDRDYFTWAKSGPAEGKYFIGTTILSRMGETKGRYIVPVASAVYQNGAFVGVVVSAVDLHALATYYLELMKISDRTEVYLIDSNGDLLYNSMSSEKVGVNAFSSLKNLFIGSDKVSSLLKKAIAAGLEGNLQLSYMDDSGKVEPHLVAYSPISLGNQKWLLVMGSPAQDVKKVTAPFYIRQTAVLLLVLLTILAFELLVIRETKS